MAYTKKEKTELIKKIDKIFAAYWNERDIECTQKSCAWVNGSEVKREIIELLKSMYSYEDEIQYNKRKEHAKKFNLK